MLELERRFRQTRKENLENGDYIILCMTVQDMGYSSALIEQAFNKLVKDLDYNGDNKEYIDYLKTL